jgi:hypothetical protein
VEVREPPDIIYHYTNDVGLRGILETGRLWLSDIFSLNDPSELRHRVSYAVNFLNARAENGPPETKIFAKNVAAFHERGVERSAHFFVLSFSSDGDDLGQWRAYADNGRGYALGFDGRTLENVFTKDKDVPIENNSTYHVIYDGHDVLANLHGQIIDRVFDRISLPRGRQMDPAAISSYMARLSSLLSVHVMLGALFFKHSAYTNEREFRFLQLYRSDVLPPDVKRRYRSHEMVKYREFDWRRDAGALKRIIVGPAADRRKAIRFATECLTAFNPRKVEVTPSTIPYRAV